MRGPDSTPEADSTRRLLALAGDLVGIDFGDYRAAYLDRRIEHRIAATSSRGRREYLARVEADPLERARLADALLIKATEMFRDDFAFDALRAFLPSLFARGASSGGVRAWVPACATGEEAYSIAICLLEAADREGGEREVTVLATDVDVAALSRAAEGVVPREAAEKMDSQTLHRWAQPVAGGHRLDARVRDTIRFSRHDLLDRGSVAPRESVLASFDLVACRNLLVYLEDDARARACSRIVAACEPDALVMFGTVELPTGPAARHLRPLDRTARLYRKHG